MQALEMIDDGEVTKSGVIVAPPSWGGSDQGQKPPAPPLPVHVIVPVQRSWEQLMVLAGLDRESRAMSVRERAVRPARRFGRMRLV